MTDVSKKWDAVYKDIRAVLDKARVESDWSRAAWRIVLDALSFTVKS